MKITAVETILLSHPKEFPPMTRSYAVVRVRTDARLVGYGEASSNYGHSYPTVVRAVVDDVLARSLVGKDPLAIAERAAEMRTLLDGYLGWDGLSSQAIGAVEIALWDILGRSRDRPIAELLGGRTRAMRLYATGTTMFDATPDWYAHYFDEALARGFRGVKVRLGDNADAAVERVAAVRAHVGSDRMVAVDAYWGYAPEDALALAHRLAPFDIAFFEEPSPQYMIDGLATLAREAPMKIAVGERVYTPSHYEQVARARAAHIFEPDACISGGLSACMEIAGIAERHGIDVIPHLGSPTAIGLAANLHWASAAGCELVEYDIYPDLPARDRILPEPLFDLARITNGVIRAPDGAGLGIDVDEDAFADLAYRSGGSFAEVFRDHEKTRS